ncbi:MAG: hypothetical protein R3B81_05840 [bacterium]
MDRRDVGREIANRIERARQAGLTPVILLDLDGTLFDNAPRSRAILRDAVLARFGPVNPFAELVAEVCAGELAYDPIDSLRRAGLDDEDAAFALREEWARRFFRSDYLDRDRAQAGAVDVVRAWRAAGVRLVYLTGRDAPDMEPGTRDSLLAAGFPLDDGAELRLRPHDHPDDVAFKCDVAREILTGGPIVAIVENDPRVLNALAGALPEAIPALMPTGAPASAPPPAARVVVLRGFADLLVAPV